MMGLLSTIRGNKKDFILGATDAGPIGAKNKKMVIQEWPRLLEQHPELFRNVWIQSATRSNSIKKAFGISDDENPVDNPTFINLSKTIQAFFYKLIITYQLDDDLVTTACERLGSRHVDFISRGFHSTFWDIFLVCMAETIDTTLSAYIRDEARKAELLLSWQRVINAIIHHMRNGYSEQRKAQLQKQQEKA
ncbi:unnamed protein product [Auanema sp. JU1783]|nr:unnamed protein product [Auanema sp. JU1783]